MEKYWVTSIENGYKRFFDYLKDRTKEKVSPPNFKKVKKYKSFTLKGKVGYKIEDIYICISLEQEEKENNRSTGNSVGIDFNS